MRLVLYSSLFLLIQSTFSIDLCTQHGNCKDCIRDVNKCVWCDTFKLNDTKCKSETANLVNWCPNKIMNPRSTFKITKEIKFSSETGKVVQIKPQQIKINIRPGDSIDFNFSFKPAQNYPVDLYFLLDGSSTMKNTKDDIVKQGENIYQTIKNMTDDVNLGVGFFVEKNVLPFTNILNSTNTYSFRNRLKLINDPEAFKKSIVDMEFGYNFDEPESALDALAQVIVCKKQIGWREESRKIIIVLTGASYHVAGDGMAGGIIEPYDGKCYTKDNIYTKESEMDYPSVGLINKLASEDEKIIIFAVNHNVLNFYNTTIYSIRGSKLVEYPGDGIVNILKNVYEDITKILKIKVNIKPEYRKYFTFSFEPDCYNSYKKYKDCKVKQNGEKEFTVTLKLLSFVEADNIKIDINIEGIKQKLEIDVGLIKKCDCVRENNSPTCNHRGSLHCGTCECEKNRYYGDSCQCEFVNSASNPMDETSCMANGTKAICNNRGSCSCGMCKCRNGYKGKFCECSDNSCERGANNELCSGPYKGVCDCGKCKCKSGWEGPICDCSTSKTDCISGDKTLCSNRGKCSCGTCKCNSISDWDARTKERVDCTLSCPEEGSCHSRQCLNIEPIVLCQLNSNDCKHSETINITVVTNLTLIQSQGSWYHCSKVIVEVGCYTKFLYRYLTDSYGIEVIMEKEIDCVEANFLWGAICFVTLIVIGVGTLIAWKFWTDRLDRLEYERIFKKATNANIPSHIFVAPTTTYKNPKYQGSTE